MRRRFWSNRSNPWYPLSQHQSRVLVLHRGPPEMYLSHIINQDYINTIHQGEKSTMLNHPRTWRLSIVVGNHKYNGCHHYKDIKVKTQWNMIVLTIKCGPNNTARPHFRLHFRQTTPIQTTAIIMMFWIMIWRRVIDSHKTCDMITENWYFEFFAFTLLVPIWPPWSVHCLLLYLSFKSLQCIAHRTLSVYFHAMTKRSRSSLWARL